MVHGFHNSVTNFQRIALILGWFADPQKNQSNLLPIDSPNDGFPLGEIENHLKRTHWSYTESGGCPYDSQQYPGGKRPQIHKNMVYKPSKTVALLLGLSHSLILILISSELECIFGILLDGFKGNLTWNWRVLFTVETNTRDSCRFSLHPITSPKYHQKKRTFSEPSVVPLYRLLDWIVQFMDCGHPLYSIYTYNCMYIMYIYVSLHAYTSIYIYI